MSYRELRTAGMLLAATTLAAGAVIALSPGAPIPRAAAAPSTPSDDRGYLNSAARCDDGQTLLMFGRTSRSLVAVCVGPDGQLEYRGVRLSDEAGLTMAATRSADGSIVATNDDVTYAINPQTLLVSEGDTVLYRDPWLEYHKAGYSAPTTESTTESTAESTTESTATPSSATPTTTAPTVSTTTVTLAPTGEN